MLRRRLAKASIEKDETPEFTGGTPSQSAGQKRAVLWQKNHNTALIPAWRPIPHAAVVSEEKSAEADFLFS